MIRKFLFSIPVAALVAIAYFFSGKIGLSLALIHPNASALWPPSGIALAFVLIFGYRVWPGVFIGAFFVNWTEPSPLSVSLGIALGNTLEALAGSYLVNRWARGRDAFRRTRHIVRFAFLAGGVSTLLSAGAGVLSLNAAGQIPSGRILNVFFTWWLGDVVSILTITPFIMIWFRMRRIPKFNIRRAVEGTLLAILIVVSGKISFQGGWFFEHLQEYPLEYLGVPFLLWAAFRFGPRGAVTAVMLFAGIAVGATLRGVGPFITDNPNESLLVMESFVSMMSISTLIISSVISERNKVQRALLKANRSLKNSLAELSNARAELERRVAERTRQLSLMNTALETEMADRMKAQKEILEISDRERKRIGQDLHDGLSQQLAGIAFMAKAVEQSIAPKSKKEAELIAQIIGMVRKAIVEANLLAKGLNPIALETNGLIAALEELAANTQGLFSVSCRFEYDESIKIENHILSINLYRIVQESVYNALRHGKAKNIVISVKPEGDMVRLSVIDDGIGIREKNRDGMGLRNMRYRATMVGAVLTIQSGPDGGSAVECLFKKEICGEAAAAGTFDLPLSPLNR